MNANVARSEICFVEESPEKLIYNLDIDLDNLDCWGSEIGFVAASLKELSNAELLRFQRVIDKTDAPHFQQFLDSSLQYGTTLNSTREYVVEYGVAQWHYFETLFRIFQNDLVFEQRLFTSDKLLDLLGDLSVVGCGAVQECLNNSRRFGTFYTPTVAVLFDEYASSLLQNNSRLLQKINQVIYPIIQSVYSKDTFLLIYSDIGGTGLPPNNLISMSCIDEHHKFVDMHNYLLSILSQSDGDQNFEVFVMPKKTDEIVEINVVDKGASRPLSMIEILNQLPNGPNELTPLKLKGSSYGNLQIPALHS